MPAPKYHAQDALTKQHILIGPSGVQGGITSNFQIAQVRSLCTASPFPKKIGEREFCLAASLIVFPGMFRTCAEWLSYLSVLCKTFRSFDIPQHNVPGQSSNLDRSSRSQAH